jgi:uncharacterized protein
MQDYRLLSFVLLLPAAVFFACSVGTGVEGQNGSPVSQRLEAFIDSIDVIDTHEHQRVPPSFAGGKANFFTLLRGEYINSDLVTAGAPSFDQKLIDSGNNDRLWDEYGRYLDYSRNTSYYGHFREGLRLLYGFGDTYFTRENTAVLSDSIAANYGLFDRWYDQAMEKTGIEMMFNDQYWSMFKPTVDHDNFALVFRIDELVRGAARRGMLTDQYGDSVNSAYHFAAKEGLELSSLDDYLDYAVSWYERFTAAGAVCAKCALAYDRTIFFEEVPKEEARRLYRIAPDRLTPSQQKKLEDFMMHWCVEKCGEYGLMLQVHTGYLAGNSGQLDNGRAKKLINLFLAHPDTRFDIFHGGYPWWLDIGALGKSFPNVFIDLVWLPQISRSAAVEALHDWLDAVPYNKFFWGGDCWTIEGAAGSLEYGRSVVTQVLTEKVEEGLMTEQLARQIALGIFRRNAVEAFGMEEKLGRSFSMP